MQIIKFNENLRNLSLKCVLHDEKIKIFLEVENGHFLKSPIFP